MNSWMHFVCLTTLLTLVLGVTANLSAQRISDKSILNVMESELTRSMEALSDQPDPPFYLSYEITDRYSARVGAYFGQLVSSNENANTTFDIDLRVGNPQLDNTRINSQVRPSFNYSSLSDHDEIQRVLWLLTDRAYKRASEQMVKVRSEKQVTIDTNSTALDLASAPQVSHSELGEPIEFPRKEWEKRVERISGVFAGHDKLYTGSMSASVSKRVRYFANSEGSRIHTDNNTYSINLHAMTRADDGSNLRLFETFHAHKASRLPSDRDLTLAAEDLVTNLIKLRAAPKVEPYTGPAILSGRASGVLFHEILGHRLEGHRLKQANDAQTFKSLVGESVLPPSFSVVFDPEQERFGNIDLLGTYRFDNEGVKGQQVTVIENGILKRFLLGRSTLNEFRESNGHGRKSTGFQAVARQSNLMVQVNEPKTPEQLEAQMIEMLKERNLEFGLYFDDIVGGYTITSRSLPNAFTVQPIIVYKIYQDGTRELVRGVDLIGTPLSVFDSIVAGGNDPHVFNGQCGAESGNLPVSAVSPSVLVSQIEVQRSAQSQSILPILPPPEA